MSDELEIGLRKQLRGKTLLGEVTFKPSHCELSAQRFNKIFSTLGFSRGMRAIQDHHPVQFALWLVNEAFYCYDGGYWPHVLPKVGLAVNQQHSSRLGTEFHVVLERLQLTRFRRLNTHWSYLGPILAHCGIPQSRLPQFFERLLPEAAALGVNSDEGLAELQQQLPSMGLSRSIEWFIRFGDKVSADFLRRSVDMYRVGRSGGELLSADALGLPERVLTAFNEWRRSAPVRVAAGSAGPAFRRPRLVLDPSQGIRLELPSQPCSVSSDYLEWDIRADTGTPLLRRAARFTGEQRTQADDVHLTAPFGSLIVRLRDASGVDAMAWSLQGLPTDRPFLCFDTEDLALLPLDRAVAGPTGILMPSDHSLWLLKGDSKQVPAVVADLGTLPFGWGTFKAAIYDLSGGTAALIGHPAGFDVRVELCEQEAATPTLSGPEVPQLTAPDRSRVFVGDAPSLAVPVNADVFRNLWKVAIEAVGEHAVAGIPLRVTRGNDVFIEDSESGGVRVPLEQPHLLGDSPWGVFEISAVGPLGEGRRFRITVVPRVRVEHDWSDLRGGAADVTCTLTAEAELSTPSGNTPPGTPVTLNVERERTPLHVGCVGYGSVRWRIPLDLYVPLPSWSLYDHADAGVLTAWATKPVSIALPETDGRSPLLLVRTATPWGVPTAATVRLCHGDTTLLSMPAPLDHAGHARIDIQPLVANARQSGFSRTRVRLDLTLARTVSLDCAWIERHWSVDGLSVRSLDSQIVISWAERFPVDGRVVRVHSQFKPWEKPRELRLSMDAKGQWLGDAGLLCPESGRYHIHLGLQDEWTGTYQLAASCHFDLGTLDDWTFNPLASELSVDGYLYRALVHASAGWEPPAIGYGDDAHTEQDTLAAKALISLRSLEDVRDPARRGIERLLDRLPLRTLARAFAASEVDAATVLSLGVLAQPRVIGDAPPLTPDEADALWRRWGAMGAWVDLEGLAAADDPAARERFVAWLGDDTLRQLGPLASRGTLALASPDGSTEQREVVDVQAPPEAQAFHVHALRGGVGLSVRRHRTASTEHMEVIDGVWSESDQASWTVQAAYATAPSPLNPPPEGQLLQLIEQGNSTVLRMVEQVCKPYPTSPIGQEAFQAACFEWAIAAAEQPSRRTDLAALCADFLPLIAEALSRREDVQVGSESLKRLRAELQARLPRLASDHPLSAVHAVTWLVASMMVWRSLGRPTLVLCPEQRLVELSSRLYALAPALFTHDLMKVCAIEALLAFKAIHAPRPSQSHD